MKSAEKSCAVVGKVSMLIEAVEVQNMFAVSDKSRKQSSMKISSRKKRCLHINVRAEIPEIKSSPYPTVCEGEISLYEGENLLLLVKKRDEKEFNRALRKNKSMSQ